MAERVLIFSASMGAGHDGAARELARRLEAEGHQTAMVDFLSCVTGVGGSLKRAYQFQLDHAPWSYEALYRAFFRLRPLYRPIAWLTTVLAARRVLRHAADFAASVVVTTYPLASLVLGRLRQKGMLPVPAVTFVTDFAVHPLWVHPGVDANLCVHPSAAEAAWRATGRPSTAPGPLVPPRFFAIADRISARRQLGVPLEARSVLVVAGSWGVGDLQETLRDMLARTDCFPIVACGRNEELRERLVALCGEMGARALVLGWTDRMDLLLAASDVLLQNAGGLTCMESFAAGVPVVTYRPIPGHGVENAIAMHQAGVAPFVRDPSELAEVLEQSFSFQGRRRAQLARSIFAGDAAEEVLAIARASRFGLPSLANATPSRGSRSPGAVRKATRGRIALSAAGMVAAYGIFAAGADAAVAKKVSHVPGGSYVVRAARFSDDQLGDTMRAIRHVAHSSLTFLDRGHNSHHSAVEHPVNL
jgi:UDP-N-acetylglucosamine:LPS N-acetylglucosamine transferase